MYGVSYIHPTLYALHMLENTCAQFTSLMARAKTLYHTCFDSLPSFDLLLIATVVSGRMDNEVFATQVALHIGACTHMLYIYI